MLIYIGVKLLFGYLKAFNAELKMKDYEIYRGMYCSLCRTLGRRYGLFARSFLSYDMTFVALLHSSASGDCPGFRSGRCPFNPAKKCSYTVSQTPGIELAADASVILSYYKILDNINDGSFITRLKARLAFPYAKRLLKKAGRRSPELLRLAEEFAGEQKKAEEQKCASIDRAADPTAKFLSALFSINEIEPGQKQALERLGYCVGRWIYLVDACDDYFDDIKSSNYNPYIYYFADKRDNEKIKEKMLGDLNDTAAHAAAALESLELKRFEDILKNVICDGMYFENKKVVTDEKPV